MVVKCYQIISFVRQSLFESNSRFALNAARHLFDRTQWPLCSIALSLFVQFNFDQFESNLTYDRYALFSNCLLCVVSVSKFIAANSLAATKINKKSHTNDKSFDCQFYLCINTRTSVTSLSISISVVLARSQSDLYFANALNQLQTSFLFSFYYLFICGLKTFICSIQILWFQRRISRRFWAICYTTMSNTFTSTKAE